LIYIKIGDKIKYRENYYYVVGDIFRQSGMYHVDIDKNSTSYKYLLHDDEFEKIEKQKISKPDYFNL